MRGARRGGAALGAGYALRSGDASSLLSFGLVLEDLRGKRPAEQALAILETIIGDASHPDESAVRHAAAEQLTRILDPTVEPPEPDEAVRGFVASFVFQLGLVELERALEGGRVSEERAVQVERSLRAWIDARVRRVVLAEGATLTPADLRNIAADVARGAMSLLQAGMA